jgi:transcriptional regulator with XRE-family HTH domain/Zn-dependent peptidase ImmA (M78 family)
MAAGLSLTELSAAAGLSPSYLTEIEKGRKYPRAAKILRIAEALNVAYDDLVSIRLDPRLAYLETALASPLFREFPFDEFGLDPAQIVELLTEAPVRASALLHAILEIGRQYDLKEEHFLRAMLRSYQEIHDNYFPEIEAAAAAFAREHDLGAARPLELGRLQALIEGRFGYRLETETLAADPLLSGYRSIAVPGPQPRLLVNRHLRPRQVKFLLAREMAYHCLGLTERSYRSTPDEVESFQQVLNDFRASYFAGALLLPQELLVGDLETLFAAATWSPDGLLAMLGRYEVTPEMLFYRFSELIPQFFGLKLHFLRFHSSAGGYHLIKRLNMNRLPLPTRLAQSEHHCRRWLVTRLLREAEHQPPGWERPLVGAQVAEFLESGERFFSLGFARPLALQPHVTSSVSVGFRDEPRLAEVIRFARDPAVPVVIVNQTCERCPLLPEECAVRAAEPVVLRAEQQAAAREAAVGRLTAAFRG